MLQLVGPVLIYDGSCGFCNASVRFILRHERKQVLLFADLHGTLAALELAPFQAEIAKTDCLILLENDQIYLCADAVIRVAKHMGGPWSALSILKFVPAVIRKMVYGFVAAHRHRIWSGAEKCEIPDERQLFRFL